MSDEDTNPHWVYDDGGREVSGFYGESGDCVTRAIAIAARLPYLKVYEDINDHSKKERPRQGIDRSDAEIGVYRPTYHRYLTKDLGATWVPRKFIGSPHKVRVHPSELPAGNLVLSQKAHLSAMVNNVVHDTDDHSTDGKIAVYGYYVLPIFEGPIYQVAIDDGENRQALSATMEAIDESMHKLTNEGIQTIIDKLQAEMVHRQDNDQEENHH